MALSDILPVLAGSFGAGLSTYGALEQQKAAEQKKREEELKARTALAEYLSGKSGLSEAAMAGVPSAGLSLGVRQQQPTYSIAPVEGAEGYLGRYQDGQFTGQMFPERRPEAERTPGMVTPSQTGEGLAYFENWWNQSGLSSAEASRRSRLFRRLRAQYPTASVGELGHYIKQAETSRLPETGMPKAGGLGSRPVPPGGR